MSFYSFHVNDNSQFGTIVKVQQLRVYISSWDEWFQTEARHIVAKFIDSQACGFVKEVTIVLRYHKKSLKNKFVAA